MSLCVKITIVFIVFQDQLTDYMIPTYSAYMVEGFLDFKAQSDESTISYYTGILESANRLTAFFACLFWAALSDRIGRKLSLLIVMSGCGIGSIGLGLSESFEVALFFRVLSGMFAGAILLTKVMLSEISSDHNIAELYGYFSMGSGLAAVFGPAIGGFCSHPYRHLNTFDSYFFREFPYFLPQIIHSLLVSTAVSMVYINVPASKVVTQENSDKNGLLRNKDYLMSVSVYCLVAFAQISYRMLMSLWVKVDPNFGGLGWTVEEYPGYLNTSAGILISLIPLYLTPAISNSLGLKKSSILLLILMLPILLLISWCYLLKGVFLWAVIVLLNGLCHTFSTVLISLASIMVTNTVLPNNAGMAMGACQSVTALGRSVAAGTTAALFGWSLTWNSFFPFNSHFMFIVIDLIVIATSLIVHLGLKSSIEKRLQSVSEQPLLGCST